MIIESDGSSIFEARIFEMEFKVSLSVSLLKHCMKKKHYEKVIKGLKSD